LAAHGSSAELQNVSSMTQNCRPTVYTVSPYYFERRCDDTKRIVSIRKQSFLFKAEYEEKLTAGLSDLGMGQFLSI